MKIKFIEHKFTGKNPELITVLDEITTENLARGRKITTRHTYYRLVSLNLISNDEATYKKITKLVDNAKQAGLLDWEAFEDKQRVIRGDTKDPYHGPFEVDIRGAVEREIKTCFNSDKWANQPYYIEVYTEKVALENYIAEAASPLNVVYMACRGYSSGQMVYEAAERFKHKMSLVKNAFCFM